MIKLQWYQNTIEKVQQNLQIGEREREEKTLNISGKGVYSGRNLTSLPDMNDGDTHPNTNCHAGRPCNDTLLDGLSHLTSPGHTGDRGEHRYTTYTSLHSRHLGQSSAWLQQCIFSWLVNDQCDESVKKRTKYIMLFIVVFFVVFVVIYRYICC